MCLTADLGVARLIPAQSHTYAEIDHEIISTAILLPSAYSRRVVVSYKRKYVHEDNLFILACPLLKLLKYFHSMQNIWLAWKPKGKTFKKNLTDPLPRLLE